MALFAVSLKEVALVQKAIDDLCRAIDCDPEYRSKLDDQRGQYQKIKEYFSHNFRFLRYRERIEPAGFYRVRKIIGTDNYKKVSDLIYPPINAVRSERMNNASFRVLYTSLNEMTAMSETRLDASYIGKTFHLTKFKSAASLEIYKIGDFARAYLNLPRKSKQYEEFCQRYLGSGYSDSVVQGYAALESVLTKALYKTSEHAYILSSLLADAIFYENKWLDAIAYPTQQNPFGFNFAFRQESADKLRIEFTHVNELVDVHPSGFYTYKTLKICDDFSDSNDLVFQIADGRNGGYF